MVEFFQGYSNMAVRQPNVLHIGLEDLCILLNAPPHLRLIKTPQSRECAHLSAPNKE